MSISTVHSAILTTFQNDSALSTEFGSEIKAGLAKMQNLSSTGKTLRVAFLSSEDMDVEESASPVGFRIRVVYGFIITFAFVEMDPVVVETRKSNYDKWIRNAIDNDTTFGGTCIGITEVGRLQVMESTGEDGYYFGAVPLVCYRDEVRGSR